MAAYRPSIVIATVLLAQLAACGAGSDESKPLASSNLASGGAHVLAASLAASKVGSIAPDQAAIQLMDFAEEMYPAYFPAHASNQTFGPFLYRAYPNGELLGVVIGTDPKYALGGVYVAGGEFGNEPVHVGPLENFITPVDPSPGSTSGGNGCFDLAMLNTEGSNSRIAYRYIHLPSSTNEGTYTYEWRVGRIVPFQGKLARVATTRRTGRLTVSGMTEQVHTSTEYSYFRRTGTSEITRYGDVTIDEGDRDATSTFIWKYKEIPGSPWLDQRYNIALGTELRVTSVADLFVDSELRIDGHTVDTQHGEFIHDPFVGERSHSIRYERRETVTVPAGTFEACRFSTSGRGNHFNPGTYWTEPGTYWIIVGKGLLIKASDGYLVQEATSISLNGVILSGNN